MRDLNKIKYSVLDLAYVREGDSIHQTFKNTLTNAQTAENLGYTRYWLSEHHNMQNVASAATSILIGYVAGGTTKIRVGSGGIMLPNHTTLSVAEQFGTLESLYPNRIDLGLGRAPGTDQLTASVLRRGNNFMNYNFEDEIHGLLNYFNPDNNISKVRAIPGEGANVPLYILGSSTDSAFLAAKLGMPYAFAGHFAPQQFYNAVKIYRTHFKASEYLDKPYIIACVNVIAAETDEDAHYLSMSMYQGFLNIISDKRQPIVSPDKTNLEAASPEQKYILESMTGLSFIGNYDSLKTSFDKFLNDAEVDEIMVSSNIYDKEAKMNSYKIISEVFN
ncbi:LLM class flavin-dependent oxidoreductase [Chishuiella sp.]|uniref:LLM class flavin-dependent oxidoreductase n=1 Tax=Chishuiella sp. TaxID=1969467 RepID=UPI0028AC7699|nr:LLM class flavin-dependent oxidoreductase [Chishuiella sp.]